MMDRDAVNSFGEVLKELRNRKKLSRRELAQRLHMHPSSIEKWERGDVLPDRARVEELLRGLKLSEAERLFLLEAHAGHRILPSLHNLPTVQNPYFVGREDILAQLHDRLKPGSQVALTQAISGLGGIGKTQVALHYVYRFHKVYSHILWVTADSPASLVTEFVRLAHDLALPEKEEKDQGKIVQAVQRWLREYLDWLLILDNVEDLSLVSSYIPAKHFGSVLVTTRRQVTEPVAQALVLDVLSEDLGALLLLKRAKRLPLEASFDSISVSEVSIARMIAHQLGGLPLALDQAGAYIAETGCSLSDYLDLFKREQQALLQRRGTVTSDHPQPVTATFSLAFEQVQQRNAAASDLLNLCAFLAPDAIPLEMITEGAAHLGAILASVVADTLQFDQILETLQSYSLMRRDGENRTLSLHRLVQVVLKDRLEEGEKLLWAKRAMLAVNAAFPSPEHSTWVWCERLLPHALLVAHSLETKDISCEETGRLLQETATYLRERARYTEAEPLSQRTIALREQHLGPEHPAVAASLNGLAILYVQQGRYLEAEPLFVRALQIKEQQLGPEHPDVAYTLNGLAILYKEQGKYTEAESLYMRALRIGEQQFGPAHPQMATPLNNLAVLYYRQGKYAEAEPLFLRALQIWEQQYGSEHPQTASPLNNLANLYLVQERYTEAEPLFLRALRIREQQWGPEHPETAYPLNNLAELYREQGKHAEAEPLYLRTLRIWEQHFGREYPMIIYPLNGLGELYREQGKHAEAETVFLRALHICEQKFGLTHPAAAYTLNGLGSLYLNQGKYAEAEPLLQSVLQMWERQWGPGHSATQLVRSKYLTLLKKLGKNETQNDT